MAPEEDRRERVHHRGSGCGVKLNEAVGMVAIGLILGFGGGYLLGTGRSANELRRARERTESLVAGSESSLGRAEHLVILHRKESARTRQRAEQLESLLHVAVGRAESIEAGISRATSRSGEIGSEVRGAIEGNRKVADLIRRATELLGPGEEGN